MIRAAVERMSGNDNQTENSNAFNSKKLFKFAFGALAGLVAIGALIWYSSSAGPSLAGSSKAPSKGGGNGGVKAIVGGGITGGSTTKIEKQQVISKLFISTAKTNIPVIVGLSIAVFVLMAVIVALVVYLVYLSSAQQQALMHVNPEDDGSITGPVVLDAEEGDQIPFWLKVTVPLVLIVGSVCLWKFYASRTPKAHVPQYFAQFEGSPDQIWKRFEALEHYRKNMSNSSKCVLYEGNEEDTTRPRVLLITQSRKEIRCPLKFSLNSIWAALPKADPFYEYEHGPEPLVALNGNHFELNSENNFRTLYNIWLQYVPLKNIPGYGGIPHPIKDAEEKNFETNFKKWHVWAIQDEICALDNVAEKFEETEHSSDVMADIDNTSVMIRCKTCSLSIRSIYSALFRGKLMGDKPFYVTYGKGLIFSGRLE